jgi:hypothetical protein
MIFACPAAEDPIDQGDILEGCPLTFLVQNNLDDPGPTEVDCIPARVLVLTQTCDLANQKASLITVAVVHDAQVLVDEGLLKPADIKGPIRGGRVFGWYFLPAAEELGLPEMIVDLRQLHTVRLTVLTALCRRGQRRARLRSLYREHLARHFADTYSRIGLPEPYKTQF